MAEKRIKIFVTGANGENGKNVLVFLMIINKGQFDIWGYLRNPDNIEKTFAHLYSSDQAESVHEHLIPKLTTDLSDIAGSDIVINFAGLNLVRLNIPEYLKSRPELKAKFDQGMLHERDLLFLENGKIAETVAKEALKRAKNCVFIQMSNPTEPLVRLVVRQGFRPGQVISCGSRMEAWRIPQVMQRREDFGGLFLKNLSTLALAEHGRSVVLFPENTFIDGQPIVEVISSRYGDNGLKALEEVFADVRDEGVWLGERLKQTPHEGPSALTVDMVKMLVSGMRIPTYLTSYFEREAYYGLEDVAACVPVMIEPDVYDDMAVSCVSRVTKINMRPERWDEFAAAVKHIKGVCEYGEG